MLRELLNETKLSPTPITTREDEAEEEEEELEAGEIVEATDEDEPTEEKEPQQQEVEQTPISPLISSLPQHQVEPQLQADVVTTLVWPIAAPTMAEETVEIASSDETETSDDEEEMEKQPPTPEPSLSQADQRTISQEAQLRLYDNVLDAIIDDGLREAVRREAGFKKRVDQLLHKHNLRM